MPKFKTGLSRAGQSITQLEQTMTSIPYRICNETLVLGRGPLRIAFDGANGRFTPLVVLIDGCRPRAVRFHAGLKSKAYLCAVRALLHSGFEKGRIHLVRRNIDAPWEDFLYPLSKAFGPELRAVRRRPRGKFTTYTFRLDRQSAPRPYQASINVISDGRDEDRLAQTLRNVFTQDLTDTVVRVVGPGALAATPLLRSTFSQVEVIPDDGVYGSDLRFPISKKKNLALQKDDADRVVLLHERIRLSPQWLARVKQESFDIYTCPMTDGSGARYVDKFGIEFDGVPTLHKRHYFLTWREDNSAQMVDGGLFVLSRRALGARRFDEALHWGEMEDVDLVLALKNAGCLVTFDRANRAASTTSSHFRLKAWSPASALYKIWVRRTHLGYRLARGFGILRGLRS